MVWTSRSYRGPLESAWSEGRLLSEREHVRPFIGKQPERFRRGPLEQGDDLSLMRWTVNEPAAFVFAMRVCERQPEGENPMQAAFAVLATYSDLLDINREIEMNEGYTSSISHDRSVGLPGEGPEGVGA